MRTLVTRWGIALVSVTVDDYKNENWKREKEFPMQNLKSNDKSTFYLKKEKFHIKEIIPMITKKNSLRWLCLLRIVLTLDCYTSFKWNSSKLSVFRHLHNIQFFKRTHSNSHVQNCSTFTFGWKVQNPELLPPPTFSWQCQKHVNEKNTR